MSKESFTERELIKVNTWVNVAEIISAMSTCQYTRVGCVILSKDYEVISTGYNGVISKAIHCCDRSFADRDEHANFVNKEEIHAEMNALLQTPQPERLKGGICFSSLQPCYECLKHMCRSGIKTFYFSDTYWRINKDEYVDDVKRSFPDIQMYFVNKEIDKWV